MHILQKYKELGHDLMQILCQNFEDAYFSDDIDVHEEYERINFVAGLNVRFRTWGDKPFYITLFNKDEYLFEIDLSLITEKDDNFTWYLNKPTNDINISLLHENYKWVEKIPSDYRNLVRAIKDAMSSGEQVPISGFSFCIDTNRSEMLLNFLDLMQKAIGAHLPSSIGSTTPKYYGVNTPVIFSIDSEKAFEGYVEDRVVTSYLRNRDIVEKCKKRDKYTCQVCDYKLKLDNRFVIECHHLKRIAKNGIQLTSIEYLICLCPNCHRIAHLREEPFTVDEIKEIIRNQSQIGRK